MIYSIVLQILQVVVGLWLVGYGLVLIVKRARSVEWRLPKWLRRSPGPADDLRILVDMAARLRDAGNVEAVRACQALIDELLLPDTPKTPEAPKTATP